MKTIEQGALEHIHNTQGEFLHKDQSFKAGVEFAQKWISVDEELPEENPFLISTMRDKTEKCLVKRQWEDNGEIVVEINELFKPSKRNKWMWNYNYNGSKIIEWRPIEIS